MTTSYDTVVWREQLGMIPRRTITILIMLAGVTGGCIAASPAWGFATLSAGIALLLFTARPVTACYAVLLGVPLTIGLAGSKIGSVLRISDALLLAAGAAFLVSMGIRREKRVHFGAVDLAYGGLIMFGTLLPFAVALQRGTPITQVDIVQLLGPIEYLLVYRVASGVLRSERQLQGALYCIIVASMVIAAGAILQPFNVLGIGRLVATLYPAASEQLQQHRATSVLRVPQAVAAYGIYVAAVIALYLQAFSACLTRRQTLILGLAALMNVVSSVATLSITSVVGLVAGLFVLGRYSTRMGHILAGLIAALAIFFLALGPFLEQRLSYQFAGASSRYATNSFVPATWQVRFSHWTDVFWPVISPNIVFGVRPSIPADFTWNSTESLYLFLLYRGGLWLLAAFVLLVGLVLRKAQALSRSTNPMVQTLARSTIVIMVVNLVLDIFDAHFFMAGEPELIAAILGMLVAADRVERGRPPAGVLSCVGTGTGQG